MAVPMNPNMGPIAGPPMDPGLGPMPGPVVGPTLVEDPPFDLRWSVIGSPVGFNRFRMPLLVNCRGPEGNEIVSTTYKLDTGLGWFLEADAQAIVRLLPRVGTNFWVRTSWYYVTGLGKLESDVQETLDPDLGFPPRAQQGTDTKDDSTLSRSYLAVGLSVDVTF